MDCKHNKPTNKVDCIVCEILADYDNDRAIDEMAFFGQPDQDVIIDVLKKLMMIIYPGFYEMRFIALTQPRIGLQFLSRT